MGNLEQKINRLELRIATLETKLKPKKKIEPSKRFDKNSVQMIIAERIVAFQNKINKIKNQKDYTPNMQAEARVIDSMLDKSTPEARKKVILFLEAGLKENNNYVMEYVVPYFGTLKTKGARYFKQKFPGYLAQANKNQPQETIIPPYHQSLKDNQYLNNH